MPPLLTTKQTGQVTSAIQLPSAWPQLASSSSFTHAHAFTGIVAIIQRQGPRPSHRHLVGWRRIQHRAGPTIEGSLPRYGDHDCPLSRLWRSSELELPGLLGHCLWNRRLLVAKRGLYWAKRLLYASLREHL